MDWKSEDLEKELEFDSDEKEQELAELEEEIEKKHPGLLPKRGRPPKYGNREKAAYPPVPPLPKAPKLSRPPLPMARDEAEVEEDMQDEEEEEEEEEPIPPRQQIQQKPKPKAWKPEQIPVETEKPKQIPVTPSVPVRRFEPYTIAQTFGVVDNTTGTVKYESHEETKLVILMLADILNRIEALDKKL